MQRHELERFIRSYIDAHPGGAVNFAWQGGEPTLMGLDFFRTVVALQQQWCPGDTEITNALQTNATLIDDEWAQFLKSERFLVGVSIDGPPQLHDQHRHGRRNQPSAHQVLAGIAALRRHAVEFNLLCTVNASNVEYPRQVYDFISDLGSDWLQFIPIVERHAGSHLAKPWSPGSSDHALTRWSVSASAYGSFMTTIFDHWFSRDSDRIHIRLFDTIINSLCGQPSGICVHDRQCGRGLAIEHDGSVYPCDHFVYPELRLGSIHTRSLAAMVEDPRQIAFGDSKHTDLSRRCRACPHLQFCWGGCPKHRFVASDDARRPENHLCAGYQQIFAHCVPRLKQLVDCLSTGRSLHADLLHAATAPAPDLTAECPCGSGRPADECHQAPRSR